MLSVLRVRHFAIIDELELEFGPGLNVFTGETGAGKSILVRALQLVLGGRGGSDVVRSGEEAAEVEALFDLHGDEPLRARLREAGYEADEELLVRRVVSRSGRTRAYLDGRLATARQLQAIGAVLADICSQHEYHSLTDPSTHLEALDAFASLQPLLQEAASAYEALRAAHEHLEALRRQAAERGEREDLLRFQLTESEELDPKPGELEALEAERERLAHAERLREAASLGEHLLYGREDAVVDVLGRIDAELEQAARFDPALQEPLQRLQEARALVEDVALELGRYARGVESDPEQLARLEERLQRLRRLARKHGGSLDDLLLRREQLREELEQLATVDVALEEAEAQLRQAQERAETAALTLRQRRREAAERLGEAIGAELRSLGMGEAEVRVELRPTEGRDGELQVAGARLTPRGIDRAELLVAPNRGEPPRPLRRIASGGELSRALLAVRRVLSGVSPAGLHVFDEVDAGVGGAVAEVIGRKLHEVSRHHQVLCITHLPQIAAYADRHFRVEKRTRGGRTQSAVRLLDEAARREELARMLGGVQVGRAARAAAEELLRAAQAHAAG